MQEKRSYHRLDVHLPMHYVVPPRCKEVPAITLDMGGTGLSFDTSEEVKVRQELLMYLFPHGRKKPVEMHAKVVRVEVDPQRPNKYRVGVRIADGLKFDEREYVKLYARHLNAQF